MRKLLQILGFVPERKTFEYYQSIGKQEQNPQSVAINRTVTPDDQPFKNWFKGGWNSHLHGTA